MVALAQLELALLRGVGARHTLRSVLATAYNSNAISVTVPIIGSSIATAYAYRDFRRAGARVERATVALTVAGIFSTVAFAVVAAAGGLITGNPAAAAVSLVAALLLAAAVAAIVVAMRFPRARTWLVGRVTAALRLSKRVIKRPKREPRSVVTDALDRVGALRLGYRTAAGTFGWALVNWIADVACLVCAIKAVGEPVPWTAILIIWTAARRRQLQPGAGRTRHRGYRADRRFGHSWAAWQVRSRRGAGVPEHRPEGTDHHGVAYLPLRGGAPPRIRAGVLTIIALIHCAVTPCRHGYSSMSWLTCSIQSQGCGD